LLYWEIAVSVPKSVEILPNTWLQLYFNLNDFVSVTKEIATPVDGSAESVNSGKEWPSVFTKIVTCRSIQVNRPVAVVYVKLAVSAGVLSVDLWEMYLEYAFSCYTVLPASLLANVSFAGCEHLPMVFYSFYVLVMNKRGHRKLVMM